MSRSRKTPAFVKLAPGEDGEGLLEIFFQHPETYKAYRDPKDGKIRNWGIFPYIPPGEDFAGKLDIPAPQIMKRKMRTQFLYGRNSSPLDLPEDQFINALIAKKKRALRSINIDDLMHSDYTIRVHMDEIENDNGGDRVWRRFRCSGGIALNTLADKILLPLMGWVRNYHGYIFKDYKDGSQYGPRDCRSVDVGHMPMNGYGYLNDDKWSLAHLLGKEGDVAGWMYDFGDSWHHTLIVEAISRPEESTGKVQVLEGGGACPAEDDGGNFKWVEDIQVLQTGTPSSRRQVLAKIGRALNYKDRRVGGDFDVDYFDLKAAQGAVSAALATPASVLSGAKRFTTPLAPGARAEMAEMYAPRKAGHRVVQTSDDQGPTFMQETISERRDKSSVAACAYCGSPHNLKKCSGCHLVQYCGAVCQAAHWKQGHKKICRAS